MEKRILNMMIGTAGGTASKGAKTYKLALPSSWVTQMGLGEDTRQVDVTFDGTAITITRRLNTMEFVTQKQAAGHDLRKLCYYDGTTLCTVLYIDFTEQTLLTENHTKSIAKTAFGRNETPTWEDLLVFWEERCIPRARAGLREYLEVLGLDEYEPMAILQKTSGRMAEDNQWLAWEVLS